MPQPFDYTLKGVEDPGDSFLSGMKQAEEMRGIFANREAAKRKEIEAQRQAQEQADMQAELAELAGNPTVSGINRVMVKYPSIGKQYKELLDSVTEQKKAAWINQVNSVYAPLASGDKQMAIRNADLVLEAAKNSGDDQTYKTAKTMRDMIKSEETGAAGDRAALAGLGMFLSAAMGPAEFAKVHEATSRVQIEREEAPAKLSKAQADAMISQNKAKYGENKQTLNTSSGIYERQDDGSWKNTGLMPFAQPQVQVSLNQGQKGFDNETTLRKEFNAEAKPFNEAMGAYSRLQSAAKDNTGASDIAIIYAYMKMLDPGSVVREGEFATAENAGGVGAKVRNMYNKVLEGKRLTAEVRSEFLSVAKNINTESKVKFNSLKRRYKGISKDYGLNPENVITLEEQEDNNPTNPSESRTVSVDY